MIVYPHVWLLCILVDIHELYVYICHYLYIYIYFVYSCIDRYVFMYVNMCVLINICL